jgi:hypothetical protein
MGLVGAVLSATAMSWHGILLSETARLAPVGSAGAVTGGVLSFGQIGALMGPSAFALLLGVTGGYSIGWALCAVPALWVGVSLLRPVERGEALISRTVGISRKEG